MWPAGQRADNEPVCGLSLRAIETIRPALCRKKDRRMGPDIQKISGAVWYLLHFKQPNDARNKPRVIHATTKDRLFDSKYRRLGLAIIQSL